MADIEELEKQLKGAKKDPCEHEKQLFRVENISNDNSKVKYYTGFSTFSALMVCYNVLGPSVNKLNYWSSGTSELKSNKGRKRLLSSLNELFLLLVRLLLGLFEQDLAYRFCVSQSTVSVIGVRLNIPPFMRGKQQLDERDLVETRRIATLRIHIKRAMEQLKTFHIFDRPLSSSFRDTANQVFFYVLYLLASHHHYVNKVIHMYLIIIIKGNTQVYTYLVQFQATYSHQKMIPIRV